MKRMNLGFSVANKGVEVKVTEVKEGIRKMKKIRRKEQDLENDAKDTAKGRSKKNKDEATYRLAEHRHLHTSSTIPLANNAHSNQHEKLHNCTDLHSM
jgi:hypothetical protein